MKLATKCVIQLPQWMTPKLTEENGVNLPAGIWPGLPLWLCMTSVTPVCFMKDYTWSLLGNMSLGGLTFVPDGNNKWGPHSTKCELYNCCFYENYQHGIDIPIIFKGPSWCKTHSVIAHNEAPLSVKPWDINPWLTSLCKMWFCRRSKQQQRTSPLITTRTSLR